MVDLISESTKAHQLYTSGVVLLCASCLGLTVAAWGFGWEQGYAATAGVAGGTAFTLLSGGFYDTKCVWRKKS